MHIKSDVLQCFHSCFLSVLCHLTKGASKNVIPAKLVLDQIGEQESIKRPKTSRKPNPRFRGSDGGFLIVSTKKKIAQYSYTDHACLQQCLPAQTSALRGLARYHYEHQEKGLTMSEVKKTPHTPIEILQAALLKEQSSYAFYDEMLQQSTVGFVSDLLEEPRDAEFHHIKMIEKKIGALERG